MEEDGEAFFGNEASDEQNLDGFRLFVFLHELPKAQINTMVDEMHFCIQPWTFMIKSFGSREITGGDEGDITEECSGRIFQFMDIECMNADGEGASCQASCLIAQECGQVGEFGVNVADMILSTEGE